MIERLAPPIVIRFPGERSLFMYLTLAETGARWGLRRQSYGLTQKQIV